MNGFAPVPSTIQAMERRHTENRVKGGYHFRIDLEGLNFKGWKGRIVTLLRFVVMTDEQDSTQPTGPNGSKAPWLAPYQ